MVKIYSNYFLPDHMLRLRFHPSSHQNKGEGVLEMNEHHDVTAFSEKCQKNRGWKFSSRGDKVPACMVSSP